jgi:hypothetical protein
MNHPKLVLPDDVDRDSSETNAETDTELFPESVVHVVLSGEQYRACIEQNFDGEPEIRAVRDNLRLAREREGDPRLQEWFEENDLGFGRSVHVDVIETGHLYGVRLPGEREIYTDVPKPNSSLADIARDLEE